MSTQTEGAFPEPTFRQRLRISMENAGYKPATMAVQMRCDATTIRNYLRGKPISYANLQLWASITGVDPVALETGRPGPGSPGPGAPLAQVTHQFRASRGSRTSHVSLAA